ncbi:McrA protein [Bacillus sp. AFS043905]|nr:McrA protein [Bacillus sp. AFS043905]
MFFVCVNPEYNIQLKQLLKGENIMNITTSLNELLKNTRLENELSVREMAKILDLEYPSLSKIENGKQKVDGNLLLKLAQEFNLDLNNLHVDSKIPIENILNKQDAIEQIHRMLIDITNQFQFQRNNPFANNPLGVLVRQELPELFYSVLGLDRDYYKVTGSVGKGQWAEVPWISIFIQDITKSATKGYYIVFLFSSDGKSVFMSLNQGWTYYREKYGTKIGTEKIKRAARKLKEELIIPNEDDWITGALDLNVRGALAKGYEIGNIYAKQYTLSNFPSSKELAEDINVLLNLYNEINTLKGKRTIDEFNDALLLADDGIFFEEGEEDFQAAVTDETNQPDESSTDDQTPPGPVPRRDPIRKKNGETSYTRRAWVSRKAIRQANYTCMIDSGHKTFTSKSSNKPYSEAHHLIFISRQSDFVYELDRIENIVVLCPTCHRLLHHGEDEERDVLLEKLHAEFADTLSEAGIYIPLPELKKMYGIDL